MKGTQVSSISNYYLFDIHLHKYNYLKVTNIKHNLVSWLNTQ